MLIDWTRVIGLRRDVGEEDFEEVVELFLDEVDEVIARLGAAPDPETLQEDLHFLKGSALGLGFAAFSTHCQNGEQLCAAGNADQVDLDAVLSSYAQSRALFLQEMPRALAS